MGRSIPEEARCQHPKCKKKIFARQACVKHYRELKKTRTVSDGPLWNYWQLRERLLAIGNPLERNIIIGTYLCGSRQSEIIYLKKEDITLETIKGKPFLIFHSINRKNRKEKVKHFPISIEAETAYTDSILKWVEDMAPTTYVFNIHRPDKHVQPRTHYKYVTTNLGANFNPHWLRKLRTTHLLNGVEDEQGKWVIPPQPPHIVRRLMGWTDLRPITSYERFLVQDTARAMLYRKD